MTVELLDLYSQLRRKGIIFCFSGPISQGIVEGIGDALMQKMEREEAGQVISRKVFSIFVEQMQNVVNHSAEKIESQDQGGGDLRYGVVVVGQESGKFYVRSGNYIKKKEAAHLKEQLETLRSMNKDELKAYFKAQRKKELDQGAQGAGLGFIETARKASAPLEFDIKSVDNQYDFFAIKALI